MKTIVTLKQNILKAVLFVFISVTAITSNARISANGILPVKAESFTAAVNSNNNNRIDLKWATETEINLSHFIVERSIDGINFNDAALVFAYGNTSSRSEYLFSDNVTKVKPGSVYYRIKSIGADGQNQNSDIVIIRTDK